MLVGSPTD
ncbi:alcC, partial [Yersinia pestis PY-13]